MDRSLGTTRFEIRWDTVPPGALLIKFDLLSWLLIRLWRLSFLKYSGAFGSVSNWLFDRTVSESLFSSWMTVTEMPLYFCDRYSSKFANLITSGTRPDMQSGLNES